MARKWLRIKGVLTGVVTLCALAGSVPGAFARDYAADANVQVPGTVALAQLPREAVSTLNLIAAGGPYPYEKDGIVFGNRERLLPAHRRGYYHEYTVPTPHARNRGARRIVCGGPLQRTDNCYYSDDHYTSFNRIVE
ncbi:Guanyl-specific ribonuclease Sa3 [Paraburkholderia ribeironis]|uniref:Guanyl-specific ribonuclease Sa3 n=1 Tax=Paraburkholderia ribeironis TaxID=1247936 RepID=A0A1N7SAG4_9BURK|nr:ribonuclease [Paraburkholderia ribeironis]SIT44352.1 Guanyl-specific ribonuclease Sa3 [Paraburkholderia ribeironis]